MSGTAVLNLYNSETREKLDDIRAEGLDVFFPDFVRGWSDVLDCRIPPYDDQTIEENCTFALGVRKYYILISAETE